MMPPNPPDQPKRQRTPEQLARKKAYEHEYQQRPEVRERRKRYEQEYYQKPEVIERRKPKDRERKRELRKDPELEARRREKQREYNKRPEVKARQSAYSRRYRLTYDVRPSQLKKYGLSIELEHRMRIEQGGRCAICRIDPARDVDHDHTTGRVRALLCSGCTTAIGLMQENPDRLRAAAAYLEHHASVDSPYLQTLFDLEEDP